MNVTLLRPPRRRPAARRPSKTTEQIALGRALDDVIAAARVIVQKHVEPGAYADCLTVGHVVAVKRLREQLDRLDAAEARFVGKLPPVASHR